MAEALRRNDPRMVDKLLVASLPRSVSSVLVERVIDRTTPEYGWDCEFDGYSLTSVPEDDRQRALAMVEETLRPASSSLVKAELARLRLSTKARAESPEDLTLTFAIFSEYLAEYPGDVVTDALRWYARNEKWWPAWSELKELLDRRVRRRRALASALKAAA